MSQFRIRSVTVYRCIYTNLLRASPGFYTNDKSILSSYKTAEQVDLRLFGLIKYNDGKGQKELRIKDQIEAHWRDLAPHLGFEPGKIRTLAKSQAPNDEMMAQWLQRDPKNCWERLIQKLKDAGLKTAANDLKHALCHMIPSEND